MQWASDSGFTYMDMTVGSLPYKVNFGAKPKELCRLSEFRTPTGWIMWRSLETIARAKTWLEAHPKAFLAVRGLRRALRRRIAGSRAVEHE